MAVEIGRLRRKLEEAERELQTYKKTVGEWDIVGGFTIPHFEIPSWNSLYEQRHWAKRKRMVDNMHNMANIYAWEVDPVEEQVDLYVTAYRKSLLDADNVLVKPIIDGLRGRVLPDDTKQWINAVTTTCELTEDVNSRVEVSFIRRKE